MQCTNPVRIRNPKAGALTRVHEISGKDYGLLVPCGRCMGCRIAKTREWSMRLLHEKEMCKDACFITLTYDDDHLPSDVGLHKSDLQKFFKRFRKKIIKKIKYFACGEYGDQLGRPHFHAVVLGWEPPLEDLVFAGTSGGSKRYYSNTILECWPFGFNVVGTVTKESCNYVTGYIRKKLNGDAATKLYGNLQPPFQLQSQGLGFSYFRENISRVIDDGGLRTDYGVAGIPRYYRDKSREVGLHDFTGLSKTAAEEAEHLVSQFYDSQGFTELEKLIAVKNSRRARNLKNLKNNEIARNGINEDYL